MHPLLLVLNTDRTAEKPIKMILYREKVCSESFCCPACNERLVNMVSLSYSRVITVSFCFLSFFFHLSLFLSHTYSPLQGLKQQPPLQIRGIKKTDEGDYTCEGRIMAREKSTSGSSRSLSMVRTQSQSHLLCYFTWTQEQRVYTHLHQGSLPN